MIVIADICKAHQTEHDHADVLSFGILKWSLVPESRDHISN